MKSLVILACFIVVICGQHHHQETDDLFARLLRGDNANIYQGGPNEGNFERLNFEAEGSSRFPTNFGLNAQAEEQRFNPDIRYAANDEGGQRFSQRFPQHNQQQDSHNFAPSTNFDHFRSFQFPNY